MGDLFVTLTAPELLAKYRALVEQMVVSRLDGGSESRQLLEARAAEMGVHPLDSASVWKETLSLPHVAAALGKHTQGLRDAQARIMAVTAERDEARLNEHRLRVELGAQRRGHTITVSADGTGDYETISAALQAVGVGGRVQVRPGVYREAVRVDRPVYLEGINTGAGVVIESLQGPALTLDAEWYWVRDLTLIGKWRDPDPDGPIDPPGTPPVQAGSVGLEVKSGDGLVEECHVESEDAACVKVDGPGANPRFRNCRMEGGVHGVLVTNFGYGACHDCMITLNSKTGIEIREGGELELWRCQIKRNCWEGVAVRKSGIANLVECQVAENRSHGVWAEAGVAYLRNCRVAGNRTYGIYAERQSRIFVRDSVLANDGYGSRWVEEGSCFEVDGLSAPKVDEL